MSSQWRSGCNIACQLCLVHVWTQLVHQVVHFQTSVGVLQHSVRSPVSSLLETHLLQCFRGLFEALVVMLGTCDFIHGVQYNVMLISFRAWDIVKSAMFVRVRQGRVVTHLIRLLTTMLATVATKHRTMLQAPSTFTTGSIMRKPDSTSLAWLRMWLVLRGSPKTRVRFIARNNHLSDAYKTT